MAVDLQHELDIAEIKAWAALAESNFRMFAYWCVKWEGIKRTGNLEKTNPFKPLVDVARAINDEKLRENPLLDQFRR